MKLFKRIQFIFIIVISIFIISSSAVLSQNVEHMEEQVESFRVGSGYTEYSGSEGVSDIVARVIFTGLSLLAVIFVILIIIAGYQWMTAGGSEEKITKAKKNISNAVIGLIIILSAYAITWFIFTYLPMSAGSGGGAPTGGSGD
ncbi:MAG TPA: pilin [Patescibacteria group bacterium]|nr:pilin [Patescibacteria group bacterium]